MLLFLFLVVLSIAGIIEIIRKYVLHIKDPDAEQLLRQVESKSWYQDLIKVSEYKEVIEAQKKNGLLADPNYLHKLLSHEGTIFGFISFVKSKKEK